MKISEMIDLLQKEQIKRGDVDVILCGHYADQSETFEVIENYENETPNEIHIWTNLSDG